MPQILEAAVRWFHVDSSRVYAVGGSMGGQETLLLAALYPRLLAGASALDSATDMAARYRAFAGLPHGRDLQLFARTEIGGTPAAAPAAYAARSPIHHVRQLAESGVPLHIWWSVRDRIVVDQKQESGRLFHAILATNPEAPVTQHVGRWAHTAEMQATTRLPLALKLIKLDEGLPAGAKPDRASPPKIEPVRVRTLVIGTSIAMLLTAAPASGRTRLVIHGYPYASRCPQAGIADVVDRWGMYACNCTSYVAWALKANGRRIDWFIPGAMNAWNWPHVAKLSGLRVDSKPAVGAVAVWPRLAPPFGHVAYVTGVPSPGTIDVAEYNFPAASGSQTFVFSIRTFVPVGGAVFIHVPARSTGDRG